MYPRLLHIYGPLWIQGYGVMIAIGFLTFLFFTLRHPLRKKLISSDDYLNTVFLGLISGIVGGRMLYVLTNLDHFSSNWLQVFYPWIGGFTVIGSIMGVLLVVPFRLYYLGVSVLPLLDLATLYAPLMQSIARLGCLCAGCCYGAYAPHLLWAITFTNANGEAPLNIPLHPAQLYTSAASLLIFFILQFSARRLLSRPGTIMCCYLILENSARFITDFWRGDREPLIMSWGTLTISQVQCFSIAGFIITCILFVVIRLRQRTT